MVGSEGGKPGDFEDDELTYKRIKMLKTVTGFEDPIIEIDLRTKAGFTKSITDARTELKKNMWIKKVDPEKLARLAQKLLDLQVQIDGSTGRVKQKYKNPKRTVKRSRQDILDKADDDRQYDTKYRIMRLVSGDKSHLDIGMGHNIYLVGFVKTEGGDAAVYSKCTDAGVPFFLLHEDVTKYALPPDTSAPGTLMTSRKFSIAKVRKLVDNIDTVVSRIQDMVPKVKKAREDATTRNAAFDHSVNRGPRMQ